MREDGRERVFYGLIKKNGNGICMDRFIHRDISFGYPLVAFMTPQVTPGYACLVSLLCIRYTHTHTHTHTHHVPMPTPMPKNMRKP